MPIYKFTLQNRGRMAREKPTEAWYFDAGGDDQARIAAKQFAALRVKLMGFGAFIAAVRVEQVDAVTLRTVEKLKLCYFEDAPIRRAWIADLSSVRSYASLPAGLFENVADPTSNDLINWEYDYADTAQVVELASENSDAKIITTKRHLSLCPDFIDTTSANATGTLVGDALQVYGVTAMLDFTTYLQAGKFKTKVRKKQVDPYPAQITDVADGDPNGAGYQQFASVTVGILDSVNLKPGRYIQVKGRRHRRGTRAAIIGQQGRGGELNGIWQIQAVETGTTFSKIFLVCSNSIRVNKCLPLGTLQMVDFELATLTGAEWIGGSKRDRKGSGRHADF